MPLAGVAFAHADASAADRISACVDELRSISVEHLDAQTLGSVIAAWRGVQAVVDAGLVQAGLRADELSSAGLGAPSADALLGHGRVQGVTARRESARCRLAARSPIVAAAMASGELGVDHLDLLVRHLGRLDADALQAVASNGLERLLHEAGTLPADTFGAALRRRVELADDGSSTNDAAVDARRRSEARCWFNPRSGMGHLSATLDPEHYEALIVAIEGEVGRLATATERPKDASLAAEALVGLVCSSGNRSAREAHITVVVDANTLEHGRHQHTIAETGDGHPLSDQAISRLCCDAVVQRVGLDRGGVPIDVGRKFRTATSAQWAALRSMYASCAWDACDQPLSRCQAHHVRYWQHGGPTDLDNLVPLCGHHHHLVHDQSWQLHLEPDRSLVVRRPDGHVHATAPPPTRRPSP
jgi:hypothetical protein